MPDANAFVPDPRVTIEGAPHGPLRGLTFAAKDLFDVAGHPTGGGNHDWARTHPVPTRHAWAVQALLDAGATLIGKTITDEVSLGILGENAFDGTPLNTRAPDRVPGGSSSGSAAAVAAGLCDTALGTDTGGSVRVPASFCGLYGIRPTHGRLDLTGMLPQAPSSDTTGWFARDTATLARVSSVLLGESIPSVLPTSLIVAVDAFGFADAEVALALRPMVDRLVSLIGRVRDEVMAPQGLSIWSRAQRTLQPVEAWQTFRPWVERDNPRMAFNVARGLVAGALIGEVGVRLGGTDAAGGARPDGLSATARDDPVPADHAVSCPAEGSAAAGVGAAARSHLMPLFAWRSDRGTAGEPARRRGRWSADRAVDRGRPWQRCYADRGGAGACGTLILQRRLPWNALAERAEAEQPESGLRA